MEEALMKVKKKKKAEVLSSPSTTFCVTGATGYIGSWLVAALLQRGYTVHATVRDPEKSFHLLSLWTRGDRLRIFKADLNEEGSFDEAVRGCDGVFHVAASMEFNVDKRENIEAYVQANIVDPSIKGTLNLLKSCMNSNSVKRVVLTSSISTITAKDNNGKWKPVVDESCQMQSEHVLKTQASGWVYALSKLLTEEAAFKFAKENGIDLVSVITTTVAGPFFTATVPSSVKLLLSPITGEPEFFKILSAVNARMGSIALVHIEDICSAHIFLMEHSKAEGRYICSNQSYPLSMLVNLLTKEYSYSNKKRIPEKNYDKVPSEICSKKLRDLGFSYKHGVEDIIHQTIICCLDYGYLPPVRQ
ncbi:putative anthocyanidin reductase isoform X1 [Vigna radiata var. radiata]|uniref:Anthocyanidin reductase isoform X1 n=1 Tax=Vigna radiata var. radiata TaxID=3916 RepID=A0A1S3VUK1_VIGRR|nr:putative anthocyanidin reductase isoform X1 [Vigna radiata var. radiata]